MMVQYGVFQAQLEHITKWEYRPVFTDDDEDFKLAHLVVGVLCVFNPSGTSFPAIGNRASLSVQQLFHYMMQPRRLFTLTVGNVIVVQSPSTRPVLNDRPFLVDAKDGPTPVIFNVLSVDGVKTMHCYFEIATWINRCNELTSSGQAVSATLIEHRWEITQDIDELFMTTRTITGRAVFRTDFLLDHPVRVNPRYPDDYRASLFHPVPVNCQRKNVSVVAEANGYACNYSFDDEEQPVNLDQTSGVVKCKGTWSRGFDAGSSLLTYYTQMMESVALVVEVWGARDTPKQQLINACLRVAATFGFGGNPLRMTGYWKAMIHVDIAEKYAKLEVGGYCGTSMDHLARQLGADAFNTAQRAANFLIRNFPDDIGVLAIDGNNAGQRPLGTFANSAGFAPQNDSGSRGTFLERMVTQALLAPCMAPPSPIALGVPVSTVATDGTTTPVGNWINTPLSLPPFQIPVPTDA